MKPSLRAMPAGRALRWALCIVCVCVCVCVSVCFCASVRACVCVHAHACARVHVRAFVCNYGCLGVQCLSLVICICIACLF